MYTSMVVSFAYSGMNYGLRATPEGARFRKKIRNVKKENSELSKENISKREFHNESVIAERAEV